MNIRRIDSVLRPGLLLYLAVVLVCPGLLYAGPTHKTEDVPEIVVAADNPDAPGAEPYHTLEEKKEPGLKREITEPDHMIEEKEPGHEKEMPEPYHTLEEKKEPGLKREIAEMITLGGLIEVEAAVDGNDREGDTSDVVLATVEVIIEVQVNKYVNGHVLLLWEEDATEPVDLDEAVIEVLSPSGFVLTAGRMYLPFGVFPSHFISDPFTLELGETSESALLVGYAADNFELSVGIFNGEVDDSGDNEIDNIVASIDVSPVEWASFGVSYISDLADSDADITGLAGGPALTDTVAGFAAYLSVAMGAWMLEAEFVGSTGDFDAADLDLDLDGDGDGPKTFNLELAYAVSDRLELAAKYENSSEFFDFPEDQYGVAASYELYQHVYLAGEYLHGEYDGAGERNLVTAQLAVSF